MSKFCNEDFFKTWTAEMAYVLGFFAADGNLIKTKRGGCYFSLEINDLDILQKIKSSLQSEHKIGTRNDRKSILPRYRLQIGSKVFYKDLQKLGFSENKTKHMSVPHVPEAFFPDFLRGYFEGDGNVWVGFVNKRRKTPTYVIEVAFTSGSVKFLERLHITLKTFGIHGGCLYKARETYSRLQFSIRDSLKLYEIMYNNGYSSLCLRRKKEVFERYKKQKNANAAVV